MNKTLKLRTYRFCIGILTLISTMAIFAPLVSPYSPFTINEDQVLTAPSLNHLLGTDRFGRDNLSRLIYGSRISFFVSLSSVSLSFFLGSFLGMLSAYLAGKLDSVLSRTLELLMVIPELLLALVVISILGSGIGKLSFTIALVYTPLFFKVARSELLRIKTAAYIEAATALGANHFYLLRRHFLPNIWPSLKVQISLSLAFAVLAEASLSFLGLGLEADQPSWGLMLAESRFWLEKAWWLALFPGIAISLSLVSLQYVAEYEKT